MIGEIIKLWCDDNNIEFVESLGYADEATKINELTLEKPTLMMCVVGNTTFGEGKIFDFKIITRRFTLVCSVDEGVDNVKNIDNKMNKTIELLISSLKPHYRSISNGGMIETNTIVNHLNCMSVAKIFTLKFKEIKACQQ